MKNKNDKTFFDLTQEEIKKYRSEFLKESYYAKKIFYVTTAIQTVMFLGIIFLIIIAILNDMDDLSIVGWIIFIGIVGYIPQEYFNINFNCWLKNKYGIKRW